MTIQEFTGERFIPGQGGAMIAYEHLHRYAFATRWASGKRVLDVATGSGWGAALLAGQAAAVWAIDIDVPSLQSAADRYGSANILFLGADGARLPFPDRCMDLVVAFEVLEHVREQEGLVKELARVTSPGGLVLVSTPDKATYSDARGYTNPFHMSEFYRDDFLRLLNGHFRRVTLYRQQVRAGSLIELGEGWGHNVEILTAPLPDPPGPEVEPMYFLALCGNADPDDPLVDGSAYLDPTDCLLQEWRKEVDRLGAWGRSLEGEVSRRDSTIADLQREFEERSRWAVSLHQEVEERNRWAISLERDVADRDATIQRVNAALDEAARRLKRIRHAFLYRVLRRLRLLPD
jgi:SAM-dependent methyltransferase